MNLLPKPPAAQATFHAHSCLTSPTTSGLNWLEKLGHNLYTAVMTTDLKLFKKRKKIQQTIQIKMKSFLRSNGVFSRGTGSSEMDLKSRQGKEIGTNMSYSVGGLGP